MVLNVLVLEIVILHEANDVVIQLALTLEFQEFIYDLREKLIPDPGSATGDKNDLSVVWNIELFL